MELLTIILIITLFTNLIIFLFAVKVIHRKGGLKFLKVFISKKFKPLQVSENDQVRLSEFATYPPTEDDTVFLGDSLFEGGKWFEFFPDSNCRNRAIGGHKTSDILARIDSILSYHPKKLMLLMGVNDLISQVPRMKTLSNYQEILKKIQTISPNTKTYVMGVLPINKKKCDEILSPKKQVILKFTNEDIDSLNNDIKQICDVTFINNYSILKDASGECISDYTYDGIHFTFEGYKTLSSILKDYIQEEVTEYSISY